MTGEIGERALISAGGWGEQEASFFIWIIPSRPLNPPPPPALSPSLFVCVTGPLRVPLSPHPKQHSTKMSN